MRFVEKVFYALQCDYPGCEVIADDGEYTYWSDQDSAVQNAQDSEWFESSDDDEMYCWEHQDRVHWTDDEDAEYTRYIELPDGQKRGIAA